MGTRLVFLCVCRDNLCCLLCVQLMRFNHRYFFYSFLDFFLFLIVMYNLAISFLFYLLLGEFDARRWERKRWRRAENNNNRGWWEREMSSTSVSRGDRWAWNFVSRPDRASAWPADSRSWSLEYCFPEAERNAWSSWQASLGTGVWVATQR